MTFQEQGYGGLTAQYLESGWAGRYVILDRMDPQQWECLAEELRVGDATSDLDQLAIEFVDATVRLGAPFDAAATRGWLDPILEEATRLVMGRFDPELVRSCQRLVTTVGVHPYLHPVVWLRAALLALVCAQNGAPDAFIDTAVDLVRDTLANLEPGVHLAVLAGARSTLGLALSARWERDHARADLDEAIAITREAVAATARDDPNRAGRLSNLAGQLRSRWQLDARQADWDEALSLAEQALALPTPDGDERGIYLSSRADFAFDQWKHDGGTAELEAASGFARQAVEATSVNGQDRVDRLSHHGELLYERWLLDSGGDDLETAIARARLALDEARGDRDRSDRLSRLAALLDERWELWGRAADLEAALAASAEAADLAGDDTPEQAWMLGNLANRRREAQRMGRPSMSLDEAIVVHRRAVAASDEGSENWAGYMNGLALDLAERFVVEGAPADLDEAIDLSRKAAGTSPLPARYRTICLNTLAGRLYDRWEFSGDRGDLDESVAVSRTVVDLTPPLGPDMPGSVANLAYKLGSRWELTGDRDDRDEMADLLVAWAERCAVGGAGRHGVTMSGPMWVRRLTAWCDEGEASLWDVAAKVGAAVLLGAERLSKLPGDADTTERREHSLAVRAAVDGVVGLACMARLWTDGDAATAITVLEQGLTVLAIEQTGGLDWDDARRQQPQLVAELFDLGHRLEAAVGGRRDGTSCSVADVEALWLQYQAKVITLETAVGHLTPRRNLVDLGSASHRSGVDVVWLVATSVGGAAMRLGPNGEAEHLMVPDLTGDLVAAWRGGLRPAADRRTSRAGSSSVRGPRGTAQPDSGVVAATISELRLVLADVDGWMGNRSWVVPAGALASLPWQAAWPGCRVHTSAGLHVIAASAATSVAASQVADAAAGEHPPMPVGGLFNPDGSLAFASDEADILGSLYSGFEDQLFRGPDATCAALTGLSHLWLLHIAAHGDDSPAVYLADGIIGPADLADLTGLFAHLRLLVLNCCFSGQLAPGAFDEALGFATAAASAGTAATLVALWPVNDAGALLFAQYFYGFLRRGRDPHVALEDARAKLARTHPTDADAYQLFGH